MDEVEIFRRIRLEALSAEPASFASSVADWQALPDEEWRRRLNEPVFVAFHAGEPVGMIGLIRERASKMAHRGTIVMVYLRRSFRGTGIAQTLLETVSGSAREVGIWQLELAVSAENQAARRFYSAQGFQEAGTIPSGFLHDGREIDEIFMVKRLARTVADGEIE